MPSYYNHSKKESDTSTSPVNISDRIKAGADKDELIVSVVEFAKTFTNKTWMEIAEEANTSITKVKEAWEQVKGSKEYQLGEEIVDAEIQKQLREFKFMKMELMKEWFASGADQESEKQESGYTSKGDIEKTTREVKGRNKSVAYFTEIRLINQSIQELLGIKKHMEVNVFQQNNNQFNIEGAGTPLVPDEHEDFIAGENSGMPLKEEDALQIPEHTDD